MKQSPLPPNAVCELSTCMHGWCWCGHAECHHADENVQPNCSECDCDGFEAAEGDVAEDGEDTNVEDSNGR